VSTTGQDSQAPLVSPATVAEWRRRQEACSEITPLSDDGETPANGFQVSGDADAISSGGKGKRTNGFHLPADARTTSLVDDGKRANGFRATDHATNGSTDSVARGFAESQQEALNAMISVARLEAPTQPLPAIKPGAPQPEPSGLIADAATAAPAAIIVQPSVVDQAGLPVRPVSVPPSQLPTTRAQASRKRTAIWDSHILTRMPGLPIAGILIVQAMLSLRLVWSNSAFQDEALYLWSGRVEWAQWLHGTAPAQDLFNPFSAYFSGSPLIYPPLGALAASIGGLAAARILSLCFMLVTTRLLYGVTQRIFGRSAALFAAALFVGAGSTQFLGALATFDAMTLMLLALATWLGVRAAESRPGAQVALLVIAASTLALADAAKYAAALFDPVVIAVIALSVWRARDLKNGIAATVIVLGVLSTLLLTGIWLGGHPYWHGIEFTTLTRASSTASIPGVLYVSGMWVGTLAILAVIGAATATFGSCRAGKARAWVLAGAVFLAPAEQAHIHTVTSLFKHVDFGAWFGCIIAGYALASLARAVPAAKASAAGAVSACAVMLAAIAGIGLAGSHFDQWPNSSKMISDLAPALTRTGCPCLLAADNVVDYYLPQQTWSIHFTTVYYFLYLDNAELRILHGVRAYQQAIANHYFKLVEIDPSEVPTLYGPVTHALAATSGYRLVDAIPSNIAHKPFEIWVYSATRLTGRGPR